MAAISKSTPTYYPQSQSNTSGEIVSLVIFCSIIGFLFILNTVHNKRMKKRINLKLDQYKKSYSSQRSTKDKPTVKLNGQVIKLSSPLIH